MTTKVGYLDLPEFKHMDMIMYLCSSKGQGSGVIM